MDLAIAIMITVLFSAVGLSGMAIAWMHRLILPEQKLKNLPPAPENSSDKKLAYAVELLKDARLNAGMNLKAEIEQFLESYERD